MPNRTTPPLPADPAAAFQVLTTTADPGLVERTSSYTPRWPDPSWAQAAPFVTLALLADADHCAGRRQAHNGWLFTQHVTSRLEAGASQTVAGVWGTDAVEHTLAARTDWSAASRAAMATVLRRASARLVPAGRPPAPTRLARRDPAAPYSSEELADLLDAATTIADQHWRTRTCLLVALHAGAGLRASDLPLLTGNDMTVDERGVLVHLPDGRLAPVRVELEQLAAATIAGWRRQFPAGGLLLPLANPSNVTFRRTPWAAGLDRPRANRLRSTWMTWVLAGGVSVQAYLSAAAVVSVDSWYAPALLLPNLDQATYLAQVRGTTTLFAPSGRALDGQPWAAPTVPLREDGSSRCTRP